MGQLTIYIDKETEEKIKMAARAAKMSLSKWVAALVRERTEKAWPESVSSLAGSWPDFPTAEQLRKGQGKDQRRESL